MSKDQSIRSRPFTEQGRKNWDKAFKKEPEKKEAKK
jgi:hypothetical protein